MLIPKRVKRRKQHRGKIQGRAHKGNIIAYGEYGLVAEEGGRITSNQIEAARIAMTRFIKARRPGMDRHLPPQAHNQAPR